MRFRTWMMLSVAVLATAGLFAADSLEKVDVEFTEEQQAAAEQVKEAGGMVLRVASNSADLDVAFHLSGKAEVDKALPHVAKLPNVTKLNLAGTDVTDAGLAAIAGLKSLERLHLERTSITDAGLAHLKGLENLQYLNLYGTAVTDKGLEYLKGLKNLKKVYLWQTKVTKEAADKLRQANKELYVNTGWDSEPAIAKPDKPEEPKEEKLTIAIIMQKGHKGADSLLAKVVDDKASKEELDQLVAFYKEMEKMKPEKGDEKSWKEKSGALLAAAEQIQKGDKAAVTALKAASNCKACHSVHR